MITDLEDSEPEKPVYGILSIAALFVGFVPGVVWAGSLRGDATGVGGFICMLKIMPIAILACAILAILELRRGDSCRTLPVLGLVCNLGPLLLGLIGVVLTIIGKE